MLFEDNICQLAYLKEQISQMMTLLCSTLPRSFFSICDTDNVSTFLAQLAEVIIYKVVYVFLCSVTEFFLLCRLSLVKSFV